ncbi:hypothetical protein [Limnohabitans sp.]
MQAAAKQVLGLTVVPPLDLYKNVGLYQHGDNPMQFIFDQDFTFTWNPDFGKEQWWFDALTVDPTKLLTNLKGIWMHGVEQPVTATQLANASIGTLPKILVYIAVHQVHGTHIWFPYHGAKHGSADKDSEGTMYEGFEFWYQGLTDEQRKQIIKLGYYNQPVGQEKFQKTASNAQKNAFEDDSEFNPDHFMVSYSTVVLVNCLQACSNSCTTLSLPRCA